MYYKINNNGGSSVVVSKDTIISKSLKEELIDSEFFDSSFKTLVQHDENIICLPLKTCALHVASFSTISRRAFSAPVSSRSAE